MSRTTSKTNHSNESVWYGWAVMLGTAAATSKGSISRSCHLLCHRKRWPFPLPATAFSFPALLAWSKITRAHRVNKTLLSHLREPWKRRRGPKSWNKCSVSLNSSLLTAERATASILWKRKTRRMCKRRRFRFQVQPNHLSNAIFSPPLMLAVNHVQFRDARACVWLSRLCGCAVTVAHTASLCVRLKPHGWVRTRKGSFREGWGGSKHRDLHASSGRTDRERLGPLKCNPAGK